MRFKDRLAQKEMQKAKDDLDKFNLFVCKGFATLALGILAVVIISALMMREAKANHETIPALEGKVAILRGTCPFDKSGKWDKGGEVKKVCTIFVIPLSEQKDGGKYWAGIWNDEGTLFQEVYEVTVGQNEVKLVWKYFGGKGKSV